ncbi:hypothetical protein AMEX_G9040 [Astyanax mexicanus]|uniref:Uncharacterized protein n=1 Tax=Astyanax mexicanus TaxID=7994 RepID=A0A8T2M0G3_ASTMX|nr:hypothetical protein AMEX_G9040 [Astyanax mexicanus]
MLERMEEERLEREMLKGMEEERLETYRLNQVRAYSQLWKTLLLLLSIVPVSKGAARDKGKHLPRIHRTKDHPCFSLKAVRCCYSNA